MPFTAAWDEDEPDDIRCGDFGPYLGNLGEEPPKPGQRKSAAPAYGRAPLTKPKRPATVKQLQFATAISRELGIKLPDERTRQSLFLFIRDNKPRFLEKHSVDRHNARMADAARFDDDPSQPDDPDGDVYMMESMGLDPYTGGFEDNY